VTRLLPSTSGCTGAALSRPVTPSTVPAIQAGTDTGRSLARSWYGLITAAGTVLLATSMSPLWA
jgi:hypothetical protein